MATTYGRSAPRQAFVRIVPAERNDGTVIIVDPDGTYLHQESQDGPGLGALAGYERGCHAVSGSTLTTSLGPTCRPEGASALDGNGAGGGISAKNGTPIPFTINSPTSVTIDGVAYRRMTPG